MNQKLLAPYSNTITCKVQGFTLSAYVDAWFADGADGIEIESIDVGEVYIVSDEERMMNIDRCVTPSIREYFQQAVEKELLIRGYKVPLTWELY